MSFRRPSRLASVVSLAAALAAIHCGNDDDLQFGAAAGSAGKGGAGRGGSGGTGGTSGKGGSQAGGQSQAGTGGQAGKGGATSKGGSGGSGGTTSIVKGGNAGAAGEDGEAGQGGDSGEGGEAGHAEAGHAGSTGEAGQAGASGEGGEGGASAGGNGGDAGAAQAGTGGVAGAAQGGSAGSAQGGNAGKAGSAQGGNGGATQGGSAGSAQGGNAQGGGGIGGIGGAAGIAGIGGAAGGVGGKAGAGGGLGGAAGIGGSMGGAGGQAGAGGGVIGVPQLIISEVRTRGSHGGTDELIEIFNPTDQTVQFDSHWTVWGRSASSGCASTPAVRFTGANTPKSIPPRSYALWVNPGPSDYDDPVQQDAGFSLGISDAGSVYLTYDNVVRDAVCFAFNDETFARFATCGDFKCEGTAVLNGPHNDTSTPASNVDVSLSRKKGAQKGELVDTGNNATDFEAVASSPRPLAAGPLPLA